MEYLDTDLQVEEIEWPVRVSTDSFADKADKKWRVPEGGVEMQSRQTVLSQDGLKMLAELCEESHKILSFPVLKKEQFLSSKLKEAGATDE